VERDFDSGGPNPLRFERYYNSFAGRTTNANGLYRFGKGGNDSQTAAMNPENEAHVSAIAADTIGVNWRHTYHRAVARSGLGSLLTASIYRPTGQVLFFSFYNGEWVTDADVNYTLNELTDAGETTGWEVTTPSDELETYSASGKLLTIADRNGVTQSLTYDAIGRVQTVTDHFGRIMTFHYAADPQGGSEWWEEPGVNARITSIADPDGEIFSYTYDVDGNLSQVTYPDSTEREYRYEDANCPYALTAIIDENDDQFATFAYDSAGRAITSWHGEGTDVVERVDVDYTTDTGDPIYGQNSAVVTEAQGTGDEIVHEMNFSRILGVSKMTSESSGTSTRSLTYDGNGNVARATDYRGNVTYRQYDARNLEISRTEAKLTSVERTITTAWHADYRLQELVMRPSVYGSGSQQTDYAYVVQSPLVESISETGFEPDGDAISRVTAFTYNGDGQVLTVDGPRTDVTDVTTFSYYDCDTGYECGQVREIENALGQITTYDAYNGRGQLLQMTGPNGLVSSYAYDERGHLESVTRMPISGPARVTTMSYDDAGQLQSVSTPDGLVLTYSYDSAHKLRSVTDNVGNRIDYNYDARGNLKDEDTYDPGNVLKRQVDYTYDLNDRLDTINNGGFVTDLTFDMVGNLISEIDPTLAETEHSYDPHDRLDLTTGALTGQTDYAYDVRTAIASR
jgi:YD repeat-containing protein